MGCSLKDGEFVKGWGVCIRDGVLVYGMGCSFRGWGVCIWDGALVHGMGCYYTG